MWFYSHHGSFVDFIDFIAFTSLPFCTEGLSGAVSVQLRLTLLEPDVWFVVVVALFLLCCFLLLECERNPGWRDFADAPKRSKRGAKSSVKP